MRSARYQQGDGVFRFKASFSPLRVPFCTYKKVHDAEAYTALACAWSKHHSGAKPDSAFFPAYRSNAPTTIEPRPS